jgi:hypothetical protein
VRSGREARGSDRLLRTVAFQPHRLVSRGVEQLVTHTVVEFEDAEHRRQLDIVAARGHLVADDDAGSDAGVAAVEGENSCQGRRLDTALAAELVGDAEPQQCRGQWQQGASARERAWAVLPPELTAPGRYDRSGGRCSFCGGRNDKRHPSIPGLVSARSGCASARAFGSLKRTRSCGLDPNLQPIPRHHHVAVGHLVDRWFIAEFRANMRASCAPTAWHRPGQAGERLTLIPCCAAVNRYRPYLRCIHR